MVIFKGCLMVFVLKRQQNLSMRSDDSTRIERTILFVCQFNSARSQLAEAQAKSMSPAGVRILSAGLTASVVNTEVLRALAEVGIDASAQRSKAIQELACEPVDDVIVLCEEVCPPVSRLFPRAAVHLWPFPDPIAMKDEHAVGTAVRRVRDDLAERLKEFLSGRVRCR